MNTMATRLQFEQMQARLVAQLNRYNSRRTGVYYRIQRRITGRNETRIQQTDRLVELCQSCINTFYCGGLLVGAAECGQIAGNCTKTFGQSVLNRLALQLQGLITATPGALPQVVASSKPSWAGTQSFTAIYGVNPAVTPHAATQLMIQQFTGGPVLVDTGFMSEALSLPQMESWMSNPNEFTACHDAAVGLLGVAGRADMQQQAGGAGAGGRFSGINLAKMLLNSPDRLYIIQVKSTARRDGHSFSLLMNNDGTVSVLEGWAMNPNRPYASLVKVWRDRNQASMPLATVLAALDNILSDNTADRDAGYGAISRAYGNNNQTSHHFEEDGARRSPRNEHSLVMVARELRPRAQVIACMAARVAAFRADRTRLRRALGHADQVYVAQMGMQAAYQARPVLLGAALMVPDPCPGGCPCFYCTHAEAKPI
jgi:hypothetical protein